MSTSKKYIIEHMEPKLWPWSMAEYKNISNIVGKENLIITNLKKSDLPKLKSYAEVHEASVKNRVIQKACILDPNAEKTLTPEDASKFNIFIFGGILGDYPRKKRTKKELTPFIKAEPRNITRKQMSTDNAVYTVNQIVKGKKINDLKFKDGVEIKKGKYESIVLPFRYNLVDGEPFMSKWVFNYLKKKKGF
jgi:ribosome biogenesis SPOUT family RNA methylase Rps3